MQLCTIRDEEGPRAYSERFKWAAVDAFREGRVNVKHVLLLKFWSGYWRDTPFLRSMGLNADLQLYRDLCGGNVQELPITLDTEHFIFHADFSMRPAYVVGFEPAFLDFMELMREHTRSAINQEVYTLSNGTPEMDALISTLSVEKDTALQESRGLRA